MADALSPMAAVPPPRITEAAYLDTERTPYYRVIMRFFLEQAEAQVTWVKADDVLAHVRRILDPGYDEPQRDRDLKALSDKRNLLAVQDTRGARTAREFRNRKLEYHIRPDALRLERFVRELERDPSTGGSLDSSLLERLWMRLVDLHRLLLEIPPEIEMVNSVRAEALWPLWEDAHGYVTTLNENTTAFHQALAESRPTDVTDLDAFDFYKRILFDNLNGFIVQLGERADLLQARFQEWEEEGLTQQLVRHLVHHRTRRLAGATEEDPAQIEAWAERQVRFVQDWFRPEGTCDRVRHATRAAIGTLTRHLQRLSERESTGQSRAQDLRALALAFSHTPDLATAHRLAVATFGAYWHRHYRVSDEHGARRDGLSVWTQAPDIIPIRAIRQGRVWRHRETSGIADVSAQQHLLLERDARMREDEAKLWDQVFRDGSLELGRVPHLPPATRDRVLAVLRECLSAESNTTLTLDGSRVTLAGPYGTDMGALRSDDGTFWTPRFRLVRTSGLDVSETGSTSSPGDRTVRVAAPDEPVTDTALGDMPEETSGEALGTQADLAEVGA